MKGASKNIVLPGCHSEPLQLRSGQAPAKNPVESMGFFAALRMTPLRNGVFKDAIVGKLFLFITLAIAFSSLPNLASASPLPLRQDGDGKITIYRPHKNDSQTFVYRAADGKYDTKVLNDIAAFFRCKLTGEAHSIDLRLIELIDAIEDHFGGETVRLICGYRSPERNAMMRRQGRGVAKNSLHMQGMAADIEVAGIRPEAVRNFAYSLKEGGVGYYGSNSFVHVDTGRQRAWGWRPPVGEPALAARR